MVILRLYWFSITDNEDKSCATSSSETGPKHKNKMSDQRQSVGSVEQDTKMNSRLKLETKPSPQVLT